MVKFKDAKQIKEFDILTYTKGFVASSVVDGVVIQEYFQFKEIHQILHHTDAAVEIVFFNDKRRVFYNDTTGESQTLYDSLNNTMTAWMNSNLN